MKTIKEIKELLKKEITTEEEQYKEDTKNMTSLNRVQNAIILHGREQYIKGLKQALVLIIENEEYE